MINGAYLSDAGVLPGMLPIASLTKGHCGSKLGRGTGCQLHLCLLSPGRVAFRLSRSTSRWARPGRESKAEAIDHLDDIIAAADAIMVARGISVWKPYRNRSGLSKRIVKVSSRRKDGDYGDTDVAIDGPSPRPARARPLMANAVWDGWTRSCCLTRLRPVSIPCPRLKQ